MAKTYLWGPSSGLYSCPLAMTDGAAMLIEVYTTLVTYYYTFCYAILV